MTTNDENDTPQHSLPISLVPFAVQLQNVVPVDIVARRFPVDFPSGMSVNFHTNIVGLAVDTEQRQAQVIMEMKVEPVVTPAPFEIFVRMVGLFTYSDEYSADEAQKYLQSGSLSVMLPFLRELVLQLSTRLQIPPIMLPIIKLGQPANTEQHTE